MKNKKKTEENYLERCPVRLEGLGWSCDEDDGMVTLSIENKGAFNKIAQVLFRKPKTSYIHLDEMGSFIWTAIDGEKTIEQIGDAVKEHFGDKAEPLYERLSKYFQILDSYGFINWR